MAKVNGFLKNKQLNMTEHPYDIVVHLLKRNDK